MKSSAPKADPRIGEAAVMSAQLGMDYMDFMKTQSEITNGWAEEDRAYYNDTFRPLEKAYVDEAQNYDTAERRDSEAAAATANVQRQSSLAAEQESRALAASGVDPRSGRSGAATARRSLATGLASVSADTAARKSVEATGEAKKLQAINMGRGYAVNPAQSMSLANGAASSGTSMAIQGQQQMGSLLNTAHQQEMDAWNASNAQWGGIGQAIGMIGGAFFPSSKGIKKTEGSAHRRSLKAVENMPVDKWTYNDGKGDGGTHVGPYAEDFAKETGLGDGRSINVIDAVGTTMGAVKALAEDVKALRRSVKPHAA